MKRRAAITVAAVCWLGILAGVALIALAPRWGWIGVTTIFAALITGLSAGSWLRRQNRSGGAS